MALFPFAAHAQSPITPKTWFVTGEAGVGVDNDGDASLAVAGAAAYPVTAQIAIEGELGHVLDLAPDDAAVDTSMTTVHGSLLYLFNTSYKLTPYVAAGLGLAKLSVNTPVVDVSATEFGINLGAGVLYPLSSGTSLRGDFRYFKHIDNLPTVWRFTGGLSVRIGS
jgi:opacity protein-like surface antigen